MEQSPAGAKVDRRAVLAYHGLPVATAVVLVGAFLLVVCLGGSYVLAGAVAVVLSILLMTRWIIVGKQIDLAGCPKCGNAFPRKLYLAYPPKVCPSCGGQTGL